MEYIYSLKFLINKTYVQKTNNQNDLCKERNNLINLYSTDKCYKCGCSGHSLLQCDDFFEKLNDMSYPIAEQEP